MVFITWRDGSEGEGRKANRRACRQRRVQAVVLDLKGPRWNGLKQKGEQADLLSRKTTQDSEFWPEKVRVRQDPHGAAHMGKKKKKEGVGFRDSFMRKKKNPFWGEISGTQRLKRHHVAEEVTAYRFRRRGCRRKWGGTAEIALGVSWNEAGSERYFCEWAHPKIFCFSSWNQRARSS